MVIAIIFTIIIWIILGFLSNDLRLKKGYDSALAFVFFFGLFALIYNAGLPDKILHDKFDKIINDTDKKTELQNESQSFSSIVSNNKNKNVSNEISMQHNEVTHKWRCPSCKNMISSIICPYCDHKKENE